MIIYFYIRRFSLLIIVAVIAQLSISSQTLAAEADKLLFEKESPYQTIYVTQHDSLVNLRAGSKYARSSAYDKDNPYRHVFEYTGLMVMGLSYLDNPQNALVFVHSPAVLYAPLDSHFVSKVHNALGVADVDVLDTSLKTVPVTLGNVTTGC